MKEKNIYESIDGRDYMLGGIGMSVHGRIETDQKIESPLFRLVTHKPVDVAAEPVTPGVATPTVPTTDVAQTPPLAQPIPPVDTPPAPVPPAPQPNEQKE